jgi:hypothetical protein
VILLGIEHKACGSLEDKNAILKPSGTSAPRKRREEASQPQALRTGVIVLIFQRSPPSALTLCRVRLQNMNAVICTAELRDLVWIKAVIRSDNGFEKLDGR